MTTAVSRAQFLRGDFHGKHAVIRPPWALPEALFTETCSACKKCIDDCPEKILIKGRAGFPEVDFSLGECTFCTKCVATCPDKALASDGEISSPWQLKAYIEGACLTHQGIVCVTCQEQCEPGAIKMKHQLGMVAIPQVFSELCNGCGACFQPCPNNAIKLKQTDLTVVISE